MKKNITLAVLTPGQKAEISSLKLSGSIRRRFQDIGAIEGTKVECLFRSPMSDPVAYQIRGSVIALRGEDAERIKVKNVR